MSAETLAVESVLIAEFGRGRTRVHLVDLIDDRYRFLARAESITTAEPPHGDLSVGLQHALQQLEEIAGRKLLRRDRLFVPQATNGDGVDAFVTLANLGDPLRVAVLDAGAESADVAAVTDALRRQEVLVYTILPPGRGARPADWASQQKLALSTWRPDLVLLLTGANAGGEVVGRMVGLIKSMAGPEVNSLSRIDEARSQLAVWAVTSDAQYTQLANELATRTNLRHLSAATPAERAERLTGDLTKLAHDRVADTMPGYDSLLAWSSAPVVSRERAATLVTQYLARSGGRRVVLVDLEGAASVCSAQSDRATAAVVADLDLELCLPNLLGMTEIGRIQRWLPSEVGDQELTHWALNRALRPLAPAAALRDQLVEQAFAREVIQVAAGRIGNGSLQQAELLIGSQRLGQWSAAGAAAGVLLDGVQPAPEAGFVILALDTTGMLPAMGALAQAEPAAAASVLEHDALVRLGTCFVVHGAADGQRALSGVIQRSSGETRDFEVKGGGIAMIPLAADETATVRLTLENRARVGAWKSGQTVQLEAPTQVQGGQAGLIFDARGRPPALPDDVRRRRERVREWYVALGIVPATGMDEAAG